MLDSNTIGPHLPLLGKITLALALVCGTASAEEIAVSAWNIAANAHSITTSVENNIAAGIALLDSDIVGLTEVKDRASLNRIVARLSSDHSLDYETRFCPRSSNLHIAILVRSGLSMSPPVNVVGTDLNETRHRQVCAVTAAIGEFDFVLATVHYKSGTAGKKVRVQQSNATAAFIRGATLFGERDVLLIGDYNMFPKRDSKAFSALSPTGFLRFLTTEELCDSNGLNCTGTHISGSSLGNMLDGYAISGNFVNEYVEGSFERVELHTQMGKTLGQFRSDVADHLPVRAKFDTSGPDDDN
jgi:hypothetical protein